MLRCWLIKLINILRYISYILSLIILTSLPRSIYVLVYLCALFLIYSLIFIINNQMYLFLVHFVEYLLFLDLNCWRRKQIIFQQQKFSLRVLLSFCWFFFPISAWCSLNKSAANNKKSVFLVILLLLAKCSILNVW